MASINTTEAAYPAAGSLTAEADTGAPETSEAGVTAAGCDPAAGVGEAAAPDAAAGTPETGIAAASGGLPAEPAALETTSLPSASSGAVAPAAPAASTQPSAPSRAPSGGVVPAGDCGCGGNGKKSYIFAIGQIGIDFGTEARRDSFRQLMPRVLTGGEPPVSVPPNPYDVYQLVRLPG